MTFPPLARQVVATITLMALPLTACSAPPGASPKAPPPPASAVRAVPPRTPSAAPASRLPLHLIKLPPGYRIDIFAEEVLNARSLARSPSGVVYVGTRRAGVVHALADVDGDGRAEKAFIIAKGLREPNGVAWRDGSLYVAEVNRIVRFDDIDARLASPPPPVVVTAALPREGHHGWKFIAFGPDGWLYVPIGAPCNICEPGDPYAAITRMKPDGSAFEVFARGVRNSVGFAWHPQTNELWFTDNGRDLLGNDLPPDELNRAPRAGMHFGYPYCHAGTIADPEFGAQRPCADFTAPEQRLGPHVASLGMRFCTSTTFAAEHQGQAFIAEHGSWNRDQPIGYRLSLVRLKDGRASSYETFAEGWLQGQEAWGRPVDVLFQPDGSLLVSDDHANAVYRISRERVPAP